jgi:hypothetical protein
MGAKYNSYEGECLVVVWVISSFQFVNFMVVNFSYRLLPLQVFDEIISTHKKVN